MLSMILKLEMAYYTSHLLLLMRDLVANEWYHSNRMIVNETKHQALVLGKTDHAFSFPLKYSLDIFRTSIDNRLRFDKITY